MDPPSGVKLRPQRSSAIDVPRTPVFDNSVSSKGSSAGAPSRHLRSMFSGKFRKNCFVCVQVCKTCNILASSLLACLLMLQHSPCLLAQIPSKKNSPLARKDRTTEPLEESTPKSGGVANSAVLHSARETITLAFIIASTWAVDRKFPNKNGHRLRFANCLLFLLFIYSPNNLQHKLSHILFPGGKNRREKYKEAKSGGCH